MGSATNDEQLYSVRKKNLRLKIQEIIDSSSTSLMFLLVPELLLS